VLSDIAILIHLPSRDFRARPRRDPGQDRAAILDPILESSSQRYVKRLEWSREVSHTCTAKSNIVTLNSQYLDTMQLVI
jgi:hypothetical protein